MTLRTDAKGQESSFDDELAEESTTYGAMLRVVAERWKRRADRGRLGRHPLDASLRFVAKLEAAASLLESARGGDRLGANDGSSTVLHETEERFRLLVE